MPDTTSAGKVYYRRVSNALAVNGIKAALFTVPTTPSVNGFSPVEALVVTWDSVGYYK